MNEKLKDDRKQSPKKKLKVISIVSLLLFFLFVRIEYIPGAELTVVDAETKEPIEGVLFLVFWKTYTGFFGGSNVKEVIGIKELESDKMGKVRFKGWIEVMPRIEWFRDKNARFVTYKNGYDGQLDYESNHHGHSGTGEFVDGIVVELTKGESYSLKTGSNYTTAMHYVKSNNYFPCIWEVIPKSLRARNEMKVVARNEKPEYIHNGIASALGHIKECPSIEEFKDRYL